MFRLSLPIVARAWRKILLLTVFGMMVFLAGNAYATGNDDVELSSADWESLRGQLEYYGWRVARSKDGSIVLRPPTHKAAEKPPAISSEPPFVAKTEAQPLGFDALRAILEVHGWNIRQDTDGSLLMFFGEPEPPPETRSEGASEAASGGVKDLRALLEDTGWRVEGSADGSILLKLPTPENAGKSTAATDAPPPASKTVAQPLGFDALRATLQHHGWIVQQDSDGSLRLFLRESESPRHELSGGTGAPATGGVSELPTLLEGTGWHVVRSADGSLLLTPPAPRVLKGVRFRFSSADLTEGSKRVLDKEIEVLRSHPNLSVKIIGHTDSLGPAALNQVLSEKRAASVKAYLVSQGLDSARFISEGRGASEPIASNATASGRTRNRRVEFLPLGER
jgi:outer membrane protein OmpA-like peptidoglycan-associated protein